MRLTGFLFFIIFLFGAFDAKAQKGLPKEYDLLQNPSPYYDNRVDNMSYWRRMAREGKVKTYTGKPAKPARFNGTQIYSERIGVQNSPDFVIAEGETTQSENAVFVDPNNNERILNSNNSSDFPVNILFGADYFVSEDEGQQWDGSIMGAGSDNNGDPSIAISNSGRFFIGKISAFYGQNVAWSDDSGLTWNEVEVAAIPGFFPDILDKNHLTIDNSLQSPFEGNLYNSWSLFAGNSPDNGQIQICRSVDQGLSWSQALVISQNVNAQSHNQGVNIATGPNGQVYCVWAIYDVWPADESAIGFARSFNGGASFEPSWRIINNIHGIRVFGANKGIRTNSFPVMTVDNSFGPYRGRIYVSWVNRGIPGINAGQDVDVYLIFSDDEGLSWSSPVRINQDIQGQGKNHFMHWICSDTETGTLSAVFYDDRNVSATECEVYAANSYNGGQSWDDFKVSDVAFTPEAITGMAGYYFGDYLGISAKGRKVYPVWTDNRSGKALTWISPYSTSPLPGQAYVVHESNYLNSFNNPGNQHLIFSDSASLDVEMKNIGDLPAQNVSVILRSTSAYVVVTDSTEFLGDLNAGESRMMNFAYRIQMLDTLPDNLKIKFILEAKDADSVWFSHFYKFTSAPELLISSPVIIDSIGNYNHVADPGEELILKTRIKNTGDYSIENLSLQLNSLSAFVIPLQASQQLDVLFPGEEKWVNFVVSLTDTIPYATTLNFLIEATSGQFVWKKFWSTRTGLIYEDWESAGFTKFPWLRTGNVQWSIAQDQVYEKMYSATSGSPGDNQQAVLSISYEVMLPDSISFYYKTSTESNYDFLEFYMDNQLMGQWSGIRAWKYASYPVNPGIHTFRWKYQKDFFESAGEDRVWLDYIRLPYFDLPTVNAGIDISACFDIDSVVMNASAANNLSLFWKSTGDGYFDFPRILNPSYFPGPGDIMAGFVKLSLKSTNAITSVSDTVLLSFVHPPATPTSTTAWPSEYCKGAVDKVDLSTSTFSNDSIYWWFNGCLGQSTGFGSPLEVDAFISSQWVYASAKNACGFSDCDSVFIQVNDSPVVDLGPDTLICRHQSLVLRVGNPDGEYLWNDGSTAGLLLVDSTFFTTSDSLLFWCKVTSPFGCTYTDSVLVKITNCNSVLYLQGKTPFIVQNNPGPGLYTLVFDKNGLDLQMEVFDTRGTKIFSKAGLTSQRNTIDLQRYSGGVYLARLSIEGKVFWLKLIKR